MKLPQSVVGSATLRRVPSELSPRHYQFLNMYANGKTKVEALRELGYKGDDGSLKITGTAILLHPESGPYIRKLIDENAEMLFLSKSKLIQDIYELIPEMRKARRYKEVLEGYSQLSKLLGYDDVKNQININGSTISFEFGNQEMILPNPETESENNDI